MVTVFQNGLTLGVFLMGGKMVQQGLMSGADFAAFMLYSVCHSVYYVHPDYNRALYIYNINFVCIQH